MSLVSNGDVQRSFRACIQSSGQVQSRLTKVPVRSKNIKFGPKWVENRRFGPKQRPNESYGLSGPIRTTPEAQTDKKRFFKENPADLGGPLHSYRRRLQCESIKSSIKACLLQELGSNTCSSEYGFVGTGSSEYGFLGVRVRRNTGSSERARWDHVRRDHVRRERVRRGVFVGNAFFRLLRRTRSQ